MKKGQALEPVPETVDKADSLGDTKRFVLRFAAQSLIGFPQFSFPTAQEPPLRGGWPLDAPAGAVRRKKGIFHALCTLKIPFLL